MLAGRSFQEKEGFEWNVYGLILFLGIKGFCEDREKQKRKKMAEASASVCLFGPVGSDHKLSA